MSGHIIAAAALVVVAVASYTLGAQVALHQSTTVQTRPSVGLQGLPGQRTVPPSLRIPHLASQQRSDVASNVPQVEEAHGSFSMGTLAGLTFAATAALVFVWNKVAAPPKWTAAGIGALDQDILGPGSADATYEVKVNWQGKDQTIKIRGNQSILMACEEAGLEVPYSCRHGVCLECTAQVVEGYEHIRKDGQCHNADNVKSGYVCTCSTFIGGNGAKLILGKAEEAYKQQFGKFEEEEKARGAQNKKMFGVF